MFTHKTGGLYYVVTAITLLITSDAVIMAIVVTK